MSTNIVASLRSGSIRNLFAALVYFDVSFMIWVLLGPLANYVSADFGLSAAQKGLLVGVPILGGAIVRIPMGILTDRLGPKRVGLIAMGTTLIPLAWGYLGSVTYHELLAVGLLLGVAGGSFAVALPLASRWYPAQHQGLALGIAGAGNSGTVLASLFAPRIAEWAGWHGAMGLAAVPLAAAFLLFLALAREPERSPAKTLRAYLRPLALKDTWYLNAFYSLTFGGFVGLASFLPVYFRDGYGVSKVQAGTLAAVCVFAGSILRPVGGFMADRLGGMRTLSLSYALAAVSLLGAAVLPPVGTAVLLFLLATSLLGIGNGSVFQLVPQRFPREIGVVTGIVGAAGGVGGFFLPSMLGFIKQLTGSFGPGLVLFAGGLAAGGVILHFLRSDWERWAEVRPPALSGGAIASRLNPDANDGMGAG